MNKPLITPTQKSIKAAENKRKARLKREKEKRKKEEMARKAAEAKKKAEAKPPKTPKPKNWYTNEIINKKVNYDGTMVYIILVIAGISLFLIGTSFFNMIRTGEPLSDHPIGFSFGVTGLIVALIGVQVDNTFNLIGHYWPRCGEKLYTRQEVDDQANSEGTEYLQGVHVFLAPEIIIGMDKGVTAIAYDEVATLGFKKMYHTKRSTPYLKSVSHSKYIDYYTYRIIVTTKSGKRFVISEDLYQQETALQAIADRCRKVDPNVRIVEMKRSLLAD